MEREQFIEKIFSTIEVSDGRLGDKKKIENIVNQIYHTIGTEISDKSKKVYDSKTETFAVPLSDIIAYFDKEGIDIVTN